MDPEFRLSRRHLFLAKVAVCVSLVATAEAVIVLFTHSGGPLGIPIFYVAWAMAPIAAASFVGFGIARSAVDAGAALICSLAAFSVGTWAFIFTRSDGYWGLLALTLPGMQLFAALVAVFVILMLNLASALARKCGL